MNFFLKYLFALFFFHARHDVKKTDKFSALKNQSLTKVEISP